jgi:hypothetical protein
VSSMQAAAARSARGDTWDAKPHATVSGVTRKVIARCCWKAVSWYCASAYAGGFRYLLWQASQLAGASWYFASDRIQLNCVLVPKSRSDGAKAIATPLPSLASKLGISRTTKLLVLGNIESEELKAAIAEAGAVEGSEANLVLICASSRSELDHSLAQWFKGKTCSGPLWIVHPKGAQSEVKGSALRELLRSRGFIDTKIASVSAKLTAIRFNKSKG